MRVSIKTIEAPGTAAPELSMTVPVTDATLWAFVTAGTTHKTNNKANATKIQFRISFPLFEPGYFN